MAKNKIAVIVVIITLFFSCGTNEPSNLTTWHCEENSTLGSRTYLVDFYKSRKDTTIYLISNFHKVSIDGNYDVKVKLIGNKYSFNPIPQQIGNSQLIINSGSGIGNANSTQIIFDYVIYDGQNDIPVHAVYTR